MRFRVMRIFAGVFWRGAALALMPVVVAACTVVVDEPGPGPRPGPEFCTREYRPVCARRGENRQTFANACLADRAGYSIVRDGACRGGGSADGGEPRSCTREYRPVCARRDDNRQTFGNACLADEAGYRVIGEGACRGGGGADEGANGQPGFCTREYAPVCAARRGNLRTFANACEARAADWRIVDPEAPC